MLDGSRYWTRRAEDDGFFSFCKHKNDATRFDADEVDQIIMSFGFEYPSLVFTVQEAPVSFRLSEGTQRLFSRFYQPELVSPDPQTYDLG
jgi:hypothetical protein